MRADTDLYSECRDTDRSIEAAVSDEHLTRGGKFATNSIESPDSRGRRGILKESRRFYARQIERFTSVTCANTTPLTVNSRQRLLTPVNPRRGSTDRPDRRSGRTTQPPTSRAHLYPAQRN